MIKELNDLIHFVKTSVWRDEALLEFFTKNNDDLAVLYRAIWGNSCQSDTAAARSIGIGLTNYKKQARALRNQLRQLAMFFNPEKAKVDIAVKNQVEGALEVALLQLLQTRSYQHAPLKIAKRLYRRGQEYEIPAFVAEALRVMKTCVGNTEGSQTQFETYAREYWLYRSFVEAEERAADCFQWIQLPHLRKNSAQHLLELRNLLACLEPFHLKIPSRQFHIHYYLVWGYYLFESEDYTGAIENYEAAIGYFRSKTQPSAAALAMFFYSKIPAYILLERYAEGEAAALASLDYAPNGSARFFRAYEMYFSLAMHAGRYEQALDIFQTVTLHKRFGNQPAVQAEFWQLLGAYLFISYRLNDWPLPAKKLPVFRSARLANETARCAQDKTGLNVAVQIALTLLQLIEGREDVLLDHIQALDRYRSRHLQNSDAERSNLFIRILALLPKVCFKSQAFLHAANPLLERMSKLPRRLTNKHSEFEIMPYSTLVQLLACYLSEKNRKHTALPAGSR